MRGEQARSPPTTHPTSPARRYPANWSHSHPTSPPHALRSATAADNPSATAPWHTPARSAGSCFHPKQLGRGETGEHDVAGQPPEHPGRRPVRAPQDAARAVSFHRIEGRSTSSLASSKVAPCIFPDSPSALHPGQPPHRQLVQHRLGRRDPVGGRLLNSTLHAAADGRKARSPRPAPAGPRRSTRPSDQMSQDPARYPHPPPWRGSAEDDHPQNLVVGGVCGNIHRADQLAVLSITDARSHSFITLWMSCSIRKIQACAFNSWIAPTPSASHAGPGRQWARP